MSNYAGSNELKHKAATELEVVLTMSIYRIDIMLVMPTSSTSCQKTYLIFLGKIVAGCQWVFR